MTSLLLLAAAASVEFPMEPHGLLGVYKFFESDVAHFVYAEIEARVMPLRSGRFETRLGLRMDTYMGESWNNPDMKFNIYGGHWNITAELGWRTGWGLARLYTDHECFHNIDMPDTLSEYMNNIKTGVVYDPPDREPPESPVLLPTSGIPEGWASVGLYRPRGEGFQKGHDFDWSLQGGLDVPLAAYRRWTGGLRYVPEFFFHTDGDTSSRHHALVYGRYDAGPGEIEFHVTHYIRDTQPFRRLEGETFAGFRFIW
ncbi:hypothetical protein GX411_04700 [Candidatus Fermentibacteria bacterium]|nr:hypothetical protein [Candidatus Fermentibacteria bacterium]